MVAHSVLILSTTPPIPRDYGNRNRVFQTFNFFKARNYEVSLILYPFDDDWTKAIPSYYKELSGLCAYFSVIHNSRPLHQSSEDYHFRIDEWWDESIAQHLNWLFKRKPFDVFFVNYTFFSAAFHSAPKSCLKILDTHDIFSGRREMFEQHSVPAEFFYTSPEEETIAFNRADCVIAIKASEAAYIKRLCQKTVVNIPYWDADVPATSRDGRPRPRKFDHENPLVVGFIGAFNSVNHVNMARFLRRFERYIRLFDLPVRVVVAGNVCKELPDYPFLTKLGRVSHLDDFYKSIDAVIAPLEFSTGIKIKVGEALARGLPVLATANAFDGFRACHPSQTEDSVAALCERIADIATNVLSLGELTRASERSALAAERAQQSGFKALAGWLKAHARRILLVTDRPFWFRKNFVDEQIAQVIEYLAAIEKVVVIMTKKCNPLSENIHATFELVTTSVDAYRQCIEEIMESRDIAGCILAETSLPVAQMTRDSGVERIWNLKFAAHNGSTHAMLSCLISVSEAGQRESIAVSPLRYLPLHGATKLSPAHVAIYTPEKSSEWEEIALKAALALCEERGLTTCVIRAPEYYEYESSFYEATIGEQAARSVLIAPRGWERAVAQIQCYRGGAWLLVTEDYIVPEVIDEVGKPSLFESIAFFLDEEVTSSTAADANTGWSKLWAVLSET